MRTLSITNREVLASPAVVEAYNQFIAGDPTTLESIRKFLSAPDGKAPPLSEAMKQYIEFRVAQVEDMDGATAQQKLDAAFPPGFIGQLKQTYIAGDGGKGAMQKLMEVDQPPKYSAELPQPLVDLLEAARREQKGPSKERDARPQSNDLNARLAMLNELVKVQDPTLRAQLFELGKSDPMALKNILPKLNPERSAAEYQELLKLVAPHAKSIGEVQRLLDAMFWANKSDRSLRDATKPPRRDDTRPKPPTDPAKLEELRERAERDRQFAVAVADGLVPQTDTNFQRVHEIVDGFINGRIRDPRPAEPGADEGGGEKKSPSKAETGVKGGSLAAKALALEPKGGKRDGGDQGGKRDAGDQGGKRDGGDQGPPADDPTRRASGPQPGTDDGSGTNTTRVEPATSGGAVDVSALRPLHDKVQVGGKEVLFVAVDPRTKDVVVRTGKPTKEAETTYTAKQLNKEIQDKGSGPKWVHITSENGIDIYRDKEGHFHGVRPHGSGYRISDRPEYEGHKPETVLSKDAVAPTANDQGAGKTKAADPVIPDVDDKGTAAAQPDRTQQPDSKTQQPDPKAQRPDQGLRPDAQKQRQARPPERRDDVRVQDDPAFERYRGFMQLTSRGVEVVAKDNHENKVDLVAFDGHVMPDLSDVEAKITADYDTKGFTNEARDALVKALRERGYRTRTVKGRDNATTSVDEAVEMSKKVMQAGQGQNAAEFVETMKKVIGEDLPRHDAIAMGSYTATYFKRIISDAKPRISQLHQTEEGIVPEIELNWPGRRGRVRGLVLNNGTDITGLLLVDTQEVLKVSDLPKPKNDGEP